MLRGLIIRRSFVIADVILVGGAGLFAAFLGFKSFREADFRPDVVSPASPEDYEGMFAKVGPRPAYNRIVQSGIFGRAATTSGDDKEPPPVVEEPLAEAETELPLRLWGTVVSGPNDLLASAAIEVREGAPTLGAYYLNQDVLEDVILVEIRRREVILDNRRMNRLEHLKMLEGDERLAASRPPGRRPPTRGRRSQASEMITLDRHEFSQGLIDNYADLANNVDVRVYTDAQGNVKGLTASNISTIPLARKLGIQDNDVLSSVNNEQIDSVEKVYEIVNKYRNASTFRIGILRGGKPKTITYRLR